MRSGGGLAVILLLCAVYGACKNVTPYYGSKIGSFKTYVHGVVGDVYAVDHKTFFIKGFSYDGEGPDAFFWAGSTQRPDSTGFIIPDENGSKEPLKAYKNKNILIRLPSEETLKDIRWLSVWCRKFHANFAEIFISRDLRIPHPVEIGSIPTLEHGVSSKNVMVIDAQTLLVPDFKYDGKGPAAYWWASRGSRQHPRGLRLADENGSFLPLPKYTGKTVVITFPDSQTIYDYDWFGVWCEEAQVDFGSVRLPQHILVPPSPRMLGVELEFKLNCEILYDDLGFEIRWIMDREDVVIQLVAKVEPGEYMAFGLSKNDTKSEMIGADTAVTWIGKDQKGHVVDYFLSSKEQVHNPIDYEPVVTTTGSPTSHSSSSPWAVAFFRTETTIQSYCCDENNDNCVGRRGSCPDTKQPEGQNSVTLLNTASVNGYAMVTFKRPQVGSDKFDQHVYSDGPQAVVWAIGPLNDRGEVSYHSLRSEGDVLIDFARPPQWNCPQPAETTSVSRSSSSTTAKPASSKPTASVRSKKLKPSSFVHKRKQIITSGNRGGVFGQAPDSGTRASNLESGWYVPPITCPTESTFRAQIGPAGGKKGYQSITGHVGWGLAWYINGLLIPEITVQRGKTYTFIVEGGNDPGNPARHHPFYITDDPEGGFEHKPLADKRRTRIFAGVTKDRYGNYAPTAAGRLCEWKLPKQANLTPDNFETFGEFQESLELSCESGKESKMRWRPDRNTPDVIYYQCYNHRYLGWKIHVVNSCEDIADRDAEASIRLEKNITFNTFPLNTSVSDLRRGLTTQKIPNSESSRRSFLPEFKTNDGIPLVLSEPDIQRAVQTEELAKDGQRLQEDIIDSTFRKEEGMRSVNPRPFRTNGDGWTGIALNTTQPRRHQVHVLKSASRERTPWWNPIVHVPHTKTPANRQKAIQTLKTQLAIIRNTKESPADLPANSAALPPVPHAKKNFVPVVIKEIISSEKTLKRVPVIAGKRTKNASIGSIKNAHPFKTHYVNTSNGFWKESEEPSVPVFVRSSVLSNTAPMRRTTGQSTKYFADTVLNNMPISQTSIRRKTANTPRKNSDDLFFPVVISSVPKVNRTFIIKESRTTQKSPSRSPLVPVVISEKTGSVSSYFLHHILPLINHQLEEEQGRRQ